MLLLSHNWGASVSMHTIKKLGAEAVAGLQLSTNYIHLNGMGSGLTGRDMKGTRTCIRRDPPKRSAARGNAWYREEPGVEQGHGHLVGGLFSAALAAFARVGPRGGCTRGGLRRGAGRGLRGCGCGCLGGGARGGLRRSLGSGRCGGWIAVPVARAGRSRIAEQTVNHRVGVIGAALQQEHLAHASGPAIQCHVVQPSDHGSIVGGTGGHHAARHRMHRHPRVCDGLLAVEELLRGLGRAPVGENDDVGAASVVAVGVGDLEDGVRERRQGAADGGAVVEREHEAADETLQICFRAHKVVVEVEQHRRTPAAESGETHSHVARAHRDELHDALQERRVLRIHLVDRTRHVDEEDHVAHRHAAVGVKGGAVLHVHGQNHPIHHAYTGRCVGRHSGCVHCRAGVIQRTEAHLQCVCVGGAGGAMVNCVHAYVLEAFGAHRVCSGCEHDVGGEVLCLGVITYTITTTPTTPHSIRDALFEPSDGCSMGLSEYRGAAVAVQQARLCVRMSDNLCLKGTFYTENQYVTLPSGYVRYPYVPLSVCACAGVCLCCPVTCGAATHS